MLPSSSSCRADNAGVSLAAPVASAVPSTGVETLSVSELRAGMQQFLRTSGALSSLKTQLRSVIVSELLKRQGSSNKVATPPQEPDDVHEGERRVDDDKEGDVWTQRLADALVENHLRRTGRSFSLAIFSSEADVSLGSPDDDTLAGLLHFNTPVASLASKQRASLLQGVVEARLRHVGDTRGRPPGYAVGTQTDVCDADLAPPSLELRLAAVDAKYALCFARLGESTREEVDRRMASYRQDLQMQMEKDYQQRVRVFEQQQLLETRREAEKHYEVLLQHKVEELREAERSSVQRIEAERARLAQARDDVELQRAELERRHRELQGLLEERDKTTAAMEGRLNDAKQQIRVLTTQVRQLEELCGVRLVEADAARDREWRRVEDLRRLQAEHVAELQLKDEEICRLRFRLKSILAAHGVADRRGDAEEEREKAATIQEAIRKANTFQQRVSLAETPPAPHSSREEAWRSAWQSTLSPQLTATTAVNRQEQPAELQINHQPVAPVIYGAEVKKVENDEVMDVDASSAVPLHQVAADSLFAHSFHAATPMPSQKLEETQIDGEKEEGCEASDKNGHSGDTHNSKEEVVVQREETPPVVSPPASPMPNVHSKELDRPANRDEETRHTTSSSSSSSSSSSASSSLSPSLVHSSSSRSVPLREQGDTGTTTATPPAALSALSEKQNLLHSEEASGRVVVEGDECTARQGIAWTAKSQHAVLLQREAAEREERNTAGAQRGASSLDAYMTQTRQWQQAAEPIMITRDSEDDDDDSALLFGKRGSSDESF